MNYKNYKSQLWLFPEAKPPMTDNEKILEAQIKYRKGDKHGAKDLFYSIVAPARRMINSERKKKGFYLSKEDATEKSIIVAEYILEQFIKRPDFKLETPSGYIYLRVLAVLYRHKKIDELIIYTDREF